MVTVTDQQNETGRGGGQVAPKAVETIGKCVGV